MINSPDKSASECRCKIAQCTSRALVGDQSAAAKSSFEFGAKSNEVNEVALQALLWAATVLVRLSYRACITKPVSQSCLQASSEDAAHFADKAEGDTKNKIENFTFLVGHLQVQMNISW